MAAPRAATASARTPSATSITRLRSKRSAATPAGTTNRANGRTRANADDARLRRRLRQRQHEQRIRDRGRLAATGGEQLTALQQDEVAIAPQWDGGHAGAIVLLRRPGPLGPTVGPLGPTVGPLGPTVGPFADRAVQARNWPSAATASAAES